MEKGCLNKNMKINLFGALFLVAGVVGVGWLMIITKVARHFPRRGSFPPAQQVPASTLKPGQFSLPNSEKHGSENRFGLWAVWHLSRIAHNPNLKTTL
jgi:hypothetical protein